jgi:hypothetical protein
MAILNLRGSSTTEDGLLAQLEERYRNTVSELTAPHVTRATKVTLTSSTGAQSLLEPATQELLGRDPSQEEIAQFTSDLDAAEAANPVVEVTTTIPALDSDGLPLQLSGIDSAPQVNVQTSGGIDGAPFAKGWIQSNSLLAQEATIHSENETTQTLFCMVGLPCPDSSPSPSPSPSPTPSATPSPIFGG